MRELLTAALTAGGFSVWAAAGGRELLDRLAAMDGDGLPDAIVTDLRMRAGSGFAVLSEVRAKYPDLPVVLITAFGEEAVHRRALSLGAARVFDKPVELDVLRRSLRELVEQG